MHELEMLENGKASMFSGEGIMPWHQLCDPVDGVLTAAEAMKAAGLDWLVEKRQSYYPIYSTDDNGNPVVELVPDEGWFKSVRVKDQKSFGNVSEGYKIFQNHEAFSFFDAVTDKSDAEAHYTAAGSLFGGRKIFLTAKIGDTFTVAGDDAHDLYLLITNSHDGTQAFTAAVTTIRAVCNNTVTLGLNSAKSKWSLRHKSTLEGKIAEARESLEMSYRYVDAFEAEVEKLLTISVNKDQFNKVAEAIVPPAKLQHDKAVTALMDVFENEKTVNDTNAKGTAWGAYNAVTYYTDWVRKYQTPSARFKSLVDSGYADQMRNKAHTKLLALA
jgi:phage/plasmid-like protein (TIGR03299 family)